MEDVSSKFFSLYWPLKALSVIITFSTVFSPQHEIRLDFTHTVSLYASLPLLEMNEGCCTQYGILHKV